MWPKKAKNTRFDFVAKFTNFMIFKRDNPKSDSGILGRKRPSKIDQFLMKIKKKFTKKSTGGNRNRRWRYINR